VRVLVAPEVLDDFGPAVGLELDDESLAGDGVRRRAGVVLRKISGSFSVAMPVVCPVGEVRVLKNLVRAEKTGAGEQARARAETLMIQVRRLPEWIKILSRLLRKMVTSPVTLVNFTIVFTDEWSCAGGQ
jgi:hypothetical protein